MKKRICGWLFESAAGLGQLLTGFGHLLIGVAACFALYQGNGLLEKIITIQNQSSTLLDRATTIGSAVRDIQKILNEKHLSEARSTISGNKNPDTIFTQGIIPLGDPASGKIVKPTLNSDRLEFIGELRQGQLFLPYDKVRPTLSTLSDETLSDAEKYEKLEKALEVKK